MGVENKMEVVEKKRQYLRFVTELFQKFRKNNLFFLSNWLTYRVMLAFFPFLVLIMSLLSYMNLDTMLMTEALKGILPEQVFKMVNNFINETKAIRNHAVLSTSIFFVVINSINGFRAITRCINNAYDVEDRRNVIMQTLLSIVLMFIFTIAILIMLTLLLFGRQLWGLLETAFIWEPARLITAGSAVVSLIMVIIVVMLIYKLSCTGKLKLRTVFPGAIFAVLSWIIASIIFGYFVTSFSNMSAVYGSIAGIFVLMLWLNLISVILLIGNEINAYLFRKTQKDNGKEK